MISMSLDLVGDSRDMMSEGVVVEVREGSQEVINVKYVLRRKRK